MPTAPATSVSRRLLHSVHRVLDSDMFYSFTHSPLTVAAAVLTLLMMAGALLAPWIAPQNPFDLAGLDLLNSHIPPAWHEDGQPEFFLGTDDQGRDVLSTILYGSRIS
jgi:peptide/nickel transport system permease protein